MLVLPDRIELPADGLCFTDLEKLADDPAPIAALTTLKYPVNESLLSEQEAFFKHVQKRHWWLTGISNLDRKSGTTPHLPLVMARTNSETA